jgi:aromatic ring-opening dioxygenase catalytic subunit (LigB family)
MSKMPVYFVSHGGGPWPYIEGMRQQFAATERALAALPGHLPEPSRAILVVTGHWEAPVFTVSTATQPPMLYDYGGFPEHTYHVSYPAPGSPPLAGRVQQLLGDAGIPVREDASRGFDHGTFVPLMLMYPAANVPVVMLSLKSSYDAAEHIRVGQSLSALRDEGVLIVGSGMTYHNMRGFGRPESGVVAERFQQYLGAAVTQADWHVRNDMLTNWQSAEGARQAHPQEDHLIPLMVVAGAAADDQGREAFVDRIYNVPMASYAFGTG